MSPLFCLVGKNSECVFRELAQLHSAHLVILSVMSILAPICSEKEENATGQHMKLAAPLAEPARSTCAGPRKKTKLQIAALLQRVNTGNVCGRRGGTCAPEVPLDEFARYGSRRSFMMHSTVSLFAQKVLLVMCSPFVNSKVSLALVPLGRM